MPDKKRRRGSARPAPLAAQRERGAGGHHHLRHSHLRRPGRVADPPHIPHKGRQHGVAGKARRARAQQTDEGGVCVLDSCTADAARRMHGFMLESDTPPKHRSLSLPQCTPQKSHMLRPQTLQPSPSIPNNAPPPIPCHDSRRAPLTVVSFNRGARRAPFLRWLSTGSGGNKRRTGRRHSSEGVRWRSLGGRTPSAIETQT